MKFAAFLNVFLTLLFIVKGDDLPPAYPDSVSVVIPDFSVTSAQKLSLAGTASITGTKLSVCDANFGLAAGSAFWPNQLQVRGFNTTLKVTFGASTGSLNQGQGIAFVIQNSRLAVLGPLGPGMGYGDADPDDTAGIKKSVAFEMDIHQDVDLQDPASDHISVHSKGSAPNTASEVQPLVDAALTTLRGTTRDVFFVYEPKNMLTGAAEYVQIWVGGSKLKESNVDIAGKLSVDPAVGLSWVGFTSGTVSKGQEQSVLAWNFQFMGRIAPSLSKLVRKPDDVIAGSTGTVYIQDVDQYGNNMINGNEQWTVQLTDQTNVVFQRNSTSSGRYAYSFSTTKAQNSASLSINLNGQSIGASDLLSINILPADPDRNSFVYSGLDTTHPAGNQQRITVQLYDQYKNKLIEVKDEWLSKTFTVAVSGDQTGEYHLSKDSPNGIIFVDWSRTLVGTYTLTLNWDGQQVPGSDLRVKVVPAASVSSDAIVVQPSQSTVESGTQMSAYIQLRDSYNNTITNPTNDDWAVVPQMALSRGGIPVDTPPTPVQSNDGRWEFDLTQTVAGIYFGIITLGGVTLSPVQFEIIPKGAVFPPKSVLKEIGDYTNQTTAGTAQTFTVQLKDINDNDLTKYLGDLSWSVTFSDDKSTHNISAQQTSSTENSGEAIVSFNITLAGEWSILPKINGTAIDMAYWSLAINPGGGSGKTSKVSDDFLAQTRTGDVQTFKLLTKDEYGNTRSKGGDVIAATLDPKVDDGKFTFTSKDNGDSSYDCTYKIDTTGDYKMTITVNGVATSDSPHDIRCKWAGLSTPVTLAIAFGVVGFLLLVGIAVFIYRKKFHGKRVYQRVGDDSAASPLMKDQESN